MAMEFAGAIEIDPPLRPVDLDHVGAAGDGAGGPASWSVSADGSLLRATRADDVAAARDALRVVVRAVRLPRRFRGTVVAYDADSGDLVAITASNGRVTVRTLRRGARGGGGGEDGGGSPPTRPTPRRGTLASNVVDLAGRRRSASRAIG